MQLFETQGWLEKESKEEFGVWDPSPRQGTCVTKNGQLLLKMSGRWITSYLQGNVEMLAVIFLKNATC